MTGWVSSTYHISSIKRRAANMPRAKISDAMFHNLIKLNATPQMRHLLKIGPQSNRN